MPCFPNDIRLAAVPLSPPPPLRQWESPAQQVAPQRLQAAQNRDRDDGRDQAHDAILSLPGWSRRELLGITHQRFESQLGACYCGKDRRHPPDCFVEPEGKGPVPGSSILRSMSSMRILRWIIGEYHNGKEHRRLKMTRSEYWELHCDGRIDVPRMNFLRDALMQHDPLSGFQGQGRNLQPSLPARGSHRV